MKIARFLKLLVLAMVLAVIAPLHAAEGKVRVLLITGGHDFERPQFFKLFEDNPDISFKAVEHSKAQALWKAEAAKEWDVLVLYDMYQPISDDAKADFLRNLKDGKGLVVLHHAIANYQAWPEYARIIGAKYYLEKTRVDGVEKARSVWQHDVEIPIHIADPEHPVTAGVKDFVIHDETYNFFDVFSGSHVLLTTDQLLSNKVIGWAKDYEGARVVLMQSGHDHLAYENPNFIRLLRQAIRWTAKRS